MIPKRFLTATVFMLLPMVALAQSTAVVAARQKVNPNNDDWRECSVAARLTDKNEVVVVANRVNTVTPDVACAISEDGGENFGVEYFPLGVDPGAVVDPTTDIIWVSVLGPFSCHPCMSVAWRDPEDDEMSSDFYPAVDPSQGILDKPLMAVSGDGHHVIAHMLDVQGGGCSEAAWSAYSDDPTDEEEWTSVRIEPEDPVGCDFQGWGAKPVILDDDRIVVVFRGFDAGYNNDLPVVAYSDDGGLSWDPDTEEPVPVAEGSLIEAVQPFDGNVDGDTPYHIDRIKCAPDIAVDRTTEPNDVYVSFYARAEREDTTSGDRNSDIFISKSFTDPETGVLSFPGDNEDFLVQLTDDLLGLTADDDGPDQIMPSIAVDPCGGVSVVFYDNRNDPDREDTTHILDVYYVRITGYGDTNDIQQVRLTPNSFTLPSSGFLGDYHHMALAGSQPTLYPAYIAMHNDKQNCYVNKISILCSSELSAYAEGEEDACALYEKLCADGTIDADLNGDEVIDAEDEAVFFEMLAGVKKEGD